MMSSLRPHDPPRALETLARATAGPPAASIFLSFPVAKNPMYLLSGDQKGNAAPSVPASGWASVPSSERTKTISAPAGPALTNATRRPSGESTAPQELGE